MKQGLTPAEHLLGHPRSPFRTGLGGESCLRTKDFISLDIAELTSSSIWFLVFWCLWHQPAQKGVYISNHLLSPKLMVSHGLGRGTIRKHGSSPSPYLCQVPCQKFHITGDFKPVLGAMCQTSSGFFMTWKSLELSLLFRTPRAVQGDEDSHPKLWCEGFHVRHWSQEDYFLSKHRKDHWIHSYHMTRYAQKNTCFCKLQRGSKWAS